MLGTLNSINNNAKKTFKKICLKKLIQLKLNFKNLFNQK